MLLNYFYLAMLPIAILGMPFVVMRLLRYNVFLFVGIMLLIGIGIAIFFAAANQVLA